MAALVRYEQARTALAECHRVDEVKDIRDKAEAMAAYARQKNDRELIRWVTDIKVRAERRFGELSAQLEKHERARTDLSAFNGGTQTKEQALAAVGVSKSEAWRCEQLASMSPEHFEAAVATAKETAGEVTTAFMLREAKRNHGKPMKGKRADAMRQELKEAKERGVSMLMTYARLTLTAIKSQEEFTEQERELLAELEGAIAATRSVSQ